MPKIFVNYRTDDCHQAAAHIESYLSGRFGSEEVFRDSKSIRPGDNFRVRLQAASTGARALLVLIGPNWLSATDQNGNQALANEDDWIRKEILNAMQSGARIIPILCGRGMPRLSAAALPPELAPLADLQALDFDTGNAETGLVRIAAELLDLVPGLADRAAKAPSTEGVYNSITGHAGNAIQLRDLHGGSITTTTFNGPTGPVSSGAGDQNNFYGDGVNYIAGKNTGGIRQKFGSKRERGEDR
ncbi:toll/interleukin-1 receptor domain-containing protein [Saccharopolyspora sp. 5N102]|uniref:toll/interleukin-1 receptor domain-containing protein n=1 Tax=Saccharopolyspora sp. 5N102 TaxID=3375155 RepID=UPI0037AAFC08